jgi:hypothetical protein
MADRSADLTGKGNKRLPDRAPSQELLRTRTPTTTKRARRRRRPTNHFNLLSKRDENATRCPSVPTRPSTDEARRSVGAVKQGKAGPATTTRGLTLQGPHLLRSTNTRRIPARVCCADESDAAVRKEARSDTSLCAVRAWTGRYRSPDPVNLSGVGSTAPTRVDISHMVHSVLTGLLVAQCE